MPGYSIDSGKGLLFLHFTSIVTVAICGSSILLSTANKPTLSAIASSLTLYVNMSSPQKPSFGVYVNEPSGFSVSVPFKGSVTTFAVSGLPSGSVSFAKTPGAGITSSVP